MSNKEEKGDELTDRLILDVKAVVLLHDSKADLRQKLQESLVNSRDESVQKFVDALQQRKKSGAGSLLAIALGELIVASLLVIAGALVLIPTVAGINSPSQLIRYFAEEIYGSVGESPLSPYLPLIEFVLGALLMISAFYALRKAAMDLKEAGVDVKSGET